MSRILPTRAERAAFQILHDENIDEADVPPGKSIASRKTVYRKPLGAISGNVSQPIAVFPLNSLPVELIGRVIRHAVRDDRHFIRVNANFQLREPSSVGPHAPLQAARLMYKEGIQTYYAVNTFEIELMSRWVDARGPKPIKWPQPKLALALAHVRSVRIAARKFRNWEHLFSTLKAFKDLYKVVIDGTSWDLNEPGSAMSSTPPNDLRLERDSALWQLFDKRRVHVGEGGLWLAWHESDYGPGCTSPNTARAFAARIVNAAREDNWDTFYAELDPYAM